MSISPSSSCNNASDCCAMNIEFFGEYFAKPFLIIISYPYHIILKKFGKDMIFSLMHPSLKRRICNIFFLCSWFEVMVSNARRIITRMKNIFPYRNFTDFQKICHSMRGLKFFMKPANSIAILILRFFPNPATICFSNIGIKFFFGIHR